MSGAPDQRTPHRPTPGRGAPARRLRGARARDHGRAMEVVAAFWLMAKGYRLLGMRMKVQGVEIDLLARRGEVLVLVEVKARRSLDEALASVTPAQCDRLLRAGHALSARPAARALAVRLDLLAFAPGRPPRHVRDAWNGGTPVARPR